jgi:hypothetical protein
VIYLDLLKRFWPFIAGALLLAGLWWWHASQMRVAEAAGYARAMNEVRIERDTERALNEHKREVAARDYQTKVSELETRVDALLARPPVVRVCKPSTNQVRVPEAAHGPDAATLERPAVQTGDDIGGELVLYGRDCEATRRQLVSLQAWIKSLE